MSATASVDLKRELPELYRPGPEPVLVEAPERPFLMIDGTGDPRTAAAYAEALQAIYSVAYTLRFALRRGPLALDAVVMPLEGLWSAPDMSRFTADRDAWQWTLMIAEPEQVTEDLVAAARAEVSGKKGFPAVDRVRLERYAEGLSAQVLHLGPYSAEGPTVERLHRFIAEQGYVLTGRHHEIYLGDPRRTAPDRLRTIIRQPVAPAPGHGVGRSRAGRYPAATWRWSVEQQGWTQVVAAATRAPSIHNTQPWLFLARADRLELHLDRDRALPVLDPTRRQQIISCGVAVELAVVALRGAGSEAAVELMPDPGDPDHLATVRLTGSRDASAEDGALVAAITDRHTVRAPFLARSVPPELLARLGTEAEELGVWLKPITASEEEVATVFLISRAEEMEQGDPAYLAELQQWLRTDPAAVDGVPVEAVPSDDPSSRPSNWLIRDFVVGTRELQAYRPAANPDAPPPVVERPTVILLGTESDDRAAWLDSGRALGRVLLLTTAAGAAASPLTQALDWPATRERLRSRLSLVGYPQMLLRMGYPDPDTPVVASGRRPVSEVLRFEPSA